MARNDTTANAVAPTAAEETAIVAAETVRGDPLLAAAKSANWLLDYTSTVGLNAGRNARRIT
eukprot:4731239-Lingulodinium_polyedra.AAC.1